MTSRARFPVAWFFLLAVCGCSNRNDPGVISLMDAVGKTDPAPWRVILCQDRANDFLKESSGLGLATGGKLTQSADESVIPWIVTMSAEGSMLIRIDYRESETIGHVEARLREGDALIASVQERISTPGVTLELKPLEPGSYRLEVVHTVAPGAEVPIIRIVAAQLEKTAAAADRGELRMLLNWLGRTGYDSARQLPWRKRLVYSSKGRTRDCLVLSIRDTLEIPLPEEAHSRTLRLWYSGMASVPDQTPAVHVETRIEGNWKSVRQWDVPVDRQWAVADIDPALGGKWGDALRLFVSGRPSLVGISEPLLLSRTKETAKRNLLIIDLDTARADRFTCYGYTKRPTSTRLDSVMEEKGFVLFDRAYAPATWTLSSTAKFLTSRYLHGELKPDGAISEDTPFLAEILKRHGYYCVAFTAGGLLRTPGFERGFHDYRWSLGSSRVEGSFPQAGTWLTRREEPFFLFLHTYEPHFPYTRTEFVHGLSRGRLGDLAKGEHVLPPGLYPHSVMSREEQDYISALYDGGIRVSADAVVDLFRLMDRLSLWDNTVVVILSDHGEELWEHYGIFARHGHSLYEEVLRVPFMIYAPGTKGYRRVEDPVSLVDLVPTVADLLEITLTDRVDGISLAPFLAGRSIEGPRPILANMAHPLQGDGICLILDDLKYAEINHKNTVEMKRKLGNDWQPGRTSWRDLFRLSSDSEERDNLIDIAPDLAKTMQESLGAALRRVLPPIKSKDMTNGVPLRDDLVRQLQVLGYLEPE